MWKKAVRHGEERKSYLLHDLSPQLFLKCRFLKLENLWHPGPTTPRISLLSFIIFVCHLGYVDNILLSTPGVLESNKAEYEFFLPQTGCVSAASVTYSPVFHHHALMLTLNVNLSVTPPTHA